jgi:AcrR family transcriptional regulator
MARPRLISDDQIRDATRACALDHGPSVSLALIAQRLGVSQPALLKRFGSRRALLLAALCPPEDPEWVTALAADFDERPFREQLEEVLERIAAFFAAAVPCWSVLRESGIPVEEAFPQSGTPPIVRAIRTLAGWLERARHRNLVAGSHFETAAMAIIGALQGRAIMAHYLKRPWSRRSEREYVTEVAEIFARALEPQSRAAASHPSVIPDATARLDRSAAKRPRTAARRVTRPR